MKIISSYLIARPVHCCSCDHATYIPCSVGLCLFKEKGYAELFILRSVNLYPMENRGLRKIDVMHNICSAFIYKRSVHDEGSVIDMTTNRSRCIQLIIKIKETIINFVRKTLMKLL